MCNGDKGNDKFGRNKKPAMNGSFLPQFWLGMWETREFGLSGKDLREWERGGAQTHTQILMRGIVSESHSKKVMKLLNLENENCIIKNNNNFNNHNSYYYCKK